jgi:hypothetical protein
MRKLKQLKFFLLLGTLSLFFGSCNINKNLMFKTPKDATVKKDRNIRFPKMTSSASSFTPTTGKR